MCQTGLQSSKTINLRLKTIAEQDLLSGAYSLRLWFVCPSSEAADNSVFDLILSTPEGAADLTQRIDTVRQAGGKDRVLQISVQAKIHGGALSVRLEPVKGSIYICGLMMEPAALPASRPA